MSAYNHNYYLKHREEFIARAKAYREANREKQNEHARLYYHRHKEERLAYYYAHRKERLAYAKAHPRVNRVIKHHGISILRNVNKPPKPMLCTLCGRKSYLTYHHWQDDKPEIGLWICNPCHWAIHRMIKVGLIKASAKSQLKIRLVLGIKKDAPSPFEGEGGRK